MTLVASVMPLVGVKVAVQVTPPSAELTSDNVPLAIVRAAFVKPVTIFEKVRVTELVLPTLRAAGATTIVAVGRTVSMTIALLAPSEPEAPGAGSVSSTAVAAPSTIVPPLSASAVGLT